MLFNKSKEMTFSPYNSISKKAQMPQRKSSQAQDSEDNLDQLTPDDLFMDYSELQINQQCQQGDVQQNNYMLNKHQHQQQDKQLVMKSQNQATNQNQIQKFNELQNYSYDTSQKNGNGNFIFSKQKQINQVQKVGSDVNMLSNSESYILNSSKFINNNISSIIGNYSEIGNDNSNSIAFTTKQENNKSNEQNFINVYNNLNNSEQQSISLYYNNYPQSSQNAANNHNTNEFTRQSLKDQISQRLENSHQNTNFYKKIANQISESKDNQIFNGCKVQQNQQIEKSQLKANNYLNVNKQGLIKKNNCQNNNQSNNKILARRASMNDQSSIISQKQNQSYQSLFTQRQTSQVNSNIESIQVNNMKNQKIEGSQIQNSFTKMDRLKLDQINSNQTSIIKKQLLFSMIVETPDARQEVINVFEEDHISRLAYDFCIKNNMDLSKYCNFIIDRLQEALNHYNSFQTPKNINKQINVFQNSNVPKFVNNQESAVFQVTQKGITPLVSLESNTLEFCSNQSFQNFENQGSFIQNQENHIQTQNQSQNAGRINCSVSEQVFELPYKSLIYELKLSDLQEEYASKSIQNGKISKQIANEEVSQSNENQKQTELTVDSNQINAKIDPNSVAAITITLNPIENITQKMNEQINVKNIFEDQIQSQCQNIELLKQCIQKSLAQQQNIQQDFNRRRNNYSLQYESNRAYNSVDKSLLQKSINQESPNINQQPQYENDQSSNHFNRYDILKYQESQESARYNKQFQFNQKVSYSQEKYQSIKKEQAIQSGKYSVKIISPVEEMKYNDVSEFILRQSENQQQLENQSQNLKLAAHLNVKNSSFYSPTSMNSVELVQESGTKEHKAFFFGFNQEQDQINQLGVQSKKHDLKSDLIQAQNLLKNQNVKVQKQNMSSLASQFDDFKNQETNSLKSDIDKISSNQDIQKSQFQTISNKNYNSNQQNREISNIFDGITNYSSIQKDKQSINTESLRIFDERQQEMLPGLYKVCQTRIEEDEVNNQRISQQISKQVETFNTNIPTSQFHFQNFNTYQQYEQNYQGNEPDNFIQQSFANQQQSQNEESRQQSSIIGLSEQQISQAQQVNSQIDKQLTDITQQIISKQKDILQQKSDYKIQQNNQIQNNTFKEHQYNSASNKKTQYQLPPLSSNSKVHHQNSNGLSVQSSNRSLINQNLSSVKKNLFCQNNSQKYLNQKQQSQLYQNENQSFAQSNLSTARGSSCISSKYDSNQTQQKTPSANNNYSNQQINVFTARGSENQTQRNYDNFYILQNTPNTKKSVQQKRNNIEKQENFDQIKQTIFNSIMKSNPSQISSDVKQVKLNISPFIEQNKLNQQLQGPYSELYQKQLFKYQEQQPREQQFKQNLQKPASNKQNIHQKQKNNSLLHNLSNQQLNNNFKANNQPIQKRSSSFNLGRSKQNQRDSSFYSKQFINNSNTSLNKIKQNQQEIQKWNQEASQYPNEKFNINHNFKQRIYQIFSVLDCDHDGYISSEKINIKSVNDLVLFIITPILIEVLCMNRSVNIEEFSCAFLKLFFNLPKQQQRIIIDQNVEINWISDDIGSLQNLEFFNFNSPLFQQYIDKRNTMQKASNKEHNWMLDLTNKEFLEFYVSNFKSLVSETNKYLQ
ncbi:hypothetical protein ABPG72_007366 [Tetrahymena utriculariae]